MPFNYSSSGPELQILDYTTQQHKLFISIATCYAFKIVANKHWDTFDEVNDQLAKGSLDRLSEVRVLAPHSICSR